MHYQRWRRRGDPLAANKHRTFHKKFGHVRPRWQCWIWAGRLDPQGYGRHSWDLAHRVAYERFMGPIPDGLTLDHLCRTPACVNPWHLEPVTLRENLLRGDTFQARNAAKTHCKRGHPFDEENTYITPAGWRSCRSCRREHHRRYREMEAYR